ncbi:MAG: iron ABC transporter permease [Paludibacteraceae bacterium]|nr:iron ABC transporter permease [Paludibacteraceae bacterium]
MKKSTLFFILSSFLTVILFGLDLCSGSIWINLPDVLGGGSADSIEHTILLNLRLPKAIVAVLAGAALSVSGLMMQTLFRNPLAGPYILGVSSGASLGVAFVTMCSVMLAWTPFVHLGAVAAAILGSTAVLLLVMAVSRRVQSNVSLLIVGMMFGSIAGALVSLMQNFANPDALKLFIVWTLGSLESVGWTDMPLMAGIVVPGLVCAVLLMKPLNGLLLGEDYARGLGIDVRRTRLGIVLATGLLAGGVTAFCGPIAFIGVAVPHIARGILRTSNHRVTIPACALIGAGLLLICDVLCSLFVYPLPISTISALFGAPIIIWIILKNK